MPLKRLSIAIMAAFVSVSAGAQEVSVELPFKRAEIDSPQTVEIWKGFGGDYIERKDPNALVFTAELTTPEGEELVVSQLNAGFVCGGMECPIRILRGGRIVYDDGACRYLEQFSLNPTMITLFACDDAIPTIETPKE